VVRPRVPTKIQKAKRLLAEGERLFNRGEYAEAEKYFLEALELLPGHKKTTGWLNKTREKLRPVKILAPQPAIEMPRMEESINQLVILLLAVFIIAFLIALRGSYFIIKGMIAARRRQVCPDCRTINPPEAEFCQQCGVRLKIWTGITGAQKKWFAKFGWKRNPFTLDVIPSLFTGYSGQVNSIMEKVNTRSGHILVYGDKGVGKTTLLRWLTDNLRKDNHAIYVARPPLNFDELIRLVVAELKGERLARRKKFSLYELEDMVKKAKKPVVILLDEAHEFTAEIEQQMRSLGDIQNINYILAGLPETREKIKKDSPPFFDRMVLETYIDHLSQEETREMIRKRIEDVGGKGVTPFTNEALANIFKMSKGRPRMILKVCDWVMTDAIRQNLETVGTEVGKDFPGLKPEENAPEKESGGQS
jgi:type II secretory pathway predicted ATPase ExeA